MRQAILNLEESMIRQVANAGMGRSDVLKFWFGESDEGTPAFIRDAAIASLQQGETFYAHNLGLPELREAIAGYATGLRCAGAASIGADRIAVTSGGVNALMLAVQALVDAGDEVVAVTPVWPNLTAQPLIMGAKLRCLMSVTSILTALWASSPIVEGKVSGYQSYRAHIWRDTDNDRSGLLDFAFTRDDVYRAYAEWALDVPMYFIHRGGYLPVAGMTFRRFMAEGWNGERATRGDWGLHLSTLFPDGRMKRYLEVRGCDCGSMPMIAALGPFCRGLLYDPEARAAAIALTADLSWEARQRLADEVPRAGLATVVGKHTVLDLARELVAIASAGLDRLLPVVKPLIDPVREIAETGRTDRKSTRLNSSHQ